MEREIFQALVQRLRENNLADSRYVSVEEQLGIFLYAVSKNASNRTLQDQFQHSGETISRHFRAVLYALT
jgi:transcriptional antiterminator